MTYAECERRAISQAHAMLQEAGVWDVAGDLACLVDRFIKRIGSERALDEFMMAVKERCGRVPLGHIVGEVYFDDMHLVVGSGVFVPRFQSRIVQSWMETAVTIPAGEIVMDLCAGCGAIGLSIARRRSDLSVTCVERDEVAVNYLRRNIERMASKGVQVSSFSADVSDAEVFSKFFSRVGLVVANPPYVSKHQVLLPEWSDHHPLDAVYSGQDGLELIRKIILLASSLLHVGGWLAIEHGEDQVGAVQDLFAGSGFVKTQTHIDEIFSDMTGSAVLTVGSRAR